MKITKCLEVWIRFVPVTHQGLHITRSDGNTATHYLRVEQDAVALTINFCDKDDTVSKQLVYNFPEVLYYECDSCVRTKKLCDCLTDDYHASDCMARPPRKE